MADTLTTKISTKGQVILPKAVRQRRDWNTGTKLIVEETPEGVLLKKAPIFPQTKPSDVFGMLKDKYKGEPKTIEEMDAALLEAVAEDFKRSVDPNS
ncbi:AbrB/MazE/SpoVT family DNA-binding domain-containing protein [Neorhizobium lilium]|uniref:AbrB/MazE/SpoVT family DNA-binding domain-containing protein n=1 Tax=Neorhizobium lilium TaxID=2503024 RepID=A0A444LF95_9HYPH|nr:AbrB/MazE/SpoVT family DNA-binding domain-containing protein [Neorhizobium lilium]RWX76723.1 AbrB/MazE/SpoVT family DNA-binding domain-containing protein [Neorhizobium lilium]